MSLTAWTRPRRLALKPRALSVQIVNKLRNKRHERFVDKLSLVDLYASLEHAANVLGPKGRRSVENTPAPAVKGSHARRR
jgi:hypothetical protein